MITKLCGTCNNIFKDVLFVCFGLNEGMSINYICDSHFPEWPFVKSSMTPLPKRIHFKLLLMTYKALHNLAPQYLTEVLHLQTPTCTLCSADANLLTSFSRILPTVWPKKKKSVRLYKTHFVLNMLSPFVEDFIDEEAALLCRDWHTNSVRRWFSDVLSFSDDNLLLYHFSLQSVLYLHNLICPLISSIAQMFI